MRFLLQGFPFYFLHLFLRQRIHYYNFFESRFAQMIHEQLVPGYKGKKSEEPAWHSARALPLLLTASTTVDTLPFTLASPRLGLMSGINGLANLFTSALFDLTAPVTRMTGITFTLFSKLNTFPIAIITIQKNPYSMALSSYYTDIIIQLQLKVTLTVGLYGF
jgi:hypothetical protein